MQAINGFSLVNAANKVIKNVILFCQVIKMHKMYVEKNNNNNIIVTGT